jgi:hypothetical protein
VGWISWTQTRKDAATRERGVRREEGVREGERRERREERGERREERNERGEKSPGHGDWDAASREGVGGPAEQTANLVKTRCLRVVPAGEMQDNIGRTVTTPISKTT